MSSTSIGFDGDAAAPKAVAMASPPQTKILIKFLPKTNTRLYIH